MSIIGTLTPSSDDLDHFEGRISTLQLDLLIIVERTKNPRGERAPTHHVMTRTADGRAVEIGAAWMKEAKDARFKGTKFLSITIDDPSFPDKLNVHAYPQQGDHWDIVFKRRRAEPAAA